MKFGNIRAVGQIIATGSLVSNAVTLITGSAQLTGLGFATTGSNTFQGSQTVNGSLVVTGSLTAQQFIVSSSVTYLTESFASGSHKFGDSSDDTHNFTGSLLLNGTIGIGVVPTTQFNINTSSVSTQNVMTEFYNSDYTSGTRNFIRVRNSVNVGSTMSSYFGQGQDGKTYIISNDFSKNHIVIDGSTTYVGINKNTPNAQLDVNGNAIVSGSLVVTNDVTMSGSGALKLPVGSTAQRPASPSSGMLRLNSTLGQPEWYDSIGATWQTIKSPNFSVQYLVVAGGGSGGVWTETTIGYSNGYQGSDSIFSNITSTGGGGGRGYNLTSVRSSGGSGGGGAGGTSDRTPGIGTSGQGYNGGNGYNDNRAGGGGGAGAVGADATSTTHGAGGIGVSNTITGTAVYYAGGGGAAGAYNTPAGGAGGTGGGGAGAAPGSGPGTSGTANTGGGGGAADAYWGQSHGGGGAGGFRTNAGTSGGGASSEATFTAMFGGIYSVTVGAGGPAVGQPGSGGVSNKNTSSGAGGSGIVILKIPNMYFATFSAGLTTSLSTSVTGYNIYSVTAGTGTVTFT